METITLVALNRSTIYIPLALVYCRRCIEEDPVLSAKARVELKEFELDDSPEYMLWELAKSAPRVIGFSCYLWNIKLVLQLSRMIRKVLPATLIVLGGPEVSPRAREVLAGSPEIDCVVRGEGEFIFKQLVAAVVSGRQLTAVAGITYRQGRVIRENREPGFIPELDKIPSAYLKASPELSNREVCLETQRGCAFGCSFCYYTKGRRGVRVFSLKRVKQELAFLLRHKDIAIYLMDPVFNLNGKRAKEICRYIIGHNPGHVPFHTEIQAELVDKELAALLKKAGMRFVEVGLQSSDERVLANVGRAFNRGKFVMGFNFLKRAGLVVELQLILGLPGETLESFERSLNFALELDPPVLSVFKLQLLPGTSIRERAGEWGIAYSDDPPYEFIQSGTMSFADSILAQKIVNSVSLFRRNPAARKFCAAAGIPLTGLIRRWLDYMRSDGFLLNGENNAALEKEAGLFVRSLSR